MALIPVLKAAIGNQPARIWLDEDEEADQLPAFTLLPVFEAALAGAHRLQIPDDEDLTDEEIAELDTVMQAEYEQYEQLYHETATEQIPFELAEEIARLKVRVATCGHYVRKVDYRTGTLYSFIYRCEHWRSDAFVPACETCLQLRAEEMKQRAVRAVQNTHGTGRYLEVSDGLADDILDGIPKTDYCRMPGANGKSLILITNEHKIGEQLTGSRAEAIDWLNYANTPDNRRASGCLGAKPAVKQEEEDGPIAHLVTNIMRTDGLDNDQQIEAQIKMAAELVEKDIDPQTAEELQEAICTLEKTYTKHVRAAGGSVTYITIKETVKLTRISWQKDIRSKLLLMDPLFQFHDRKLHEKPLPAGN